MKLFGKVNKIVAFCLASVMALSLSSVAMAAGEVTATYDVETAHSGAISAPGTDGKQATVMVLKPGANTASVQASDIVYIDQIAVTGSSAAFTFKLADEAEGTYTVKVGGEGITTPYSGEFTIGELTLLYGDVDLTGEIDIFDIIALCERLDADVAFSEAKAETLADFNKDGSVDIFDLIALCEYVDAN